jgi:hypothetical protein
MVERGSGGGVSLSLWELGDGNLEGELHYWGTQKMRFLRDMQNAL